MIGGRSIYTKFRLNTLDELNQKSRNNTNPYICYFVNLRMKTYPQVETQIIECDICGEKHKITISCKYQISFSILLLALQIRDYH